MTTEERWWEAFGLTAQEARIIESGNPNNFDPFLRQLVEQGRISNAQAGALFEFAEDTRLFGVEEANRIRRAAVIEIGAQRGIQEQERGRLHQQLLGQAVTAGQVERTRQQGVARRTGRAEEEFFEQFGGRDQFGNVRPPPTTAAVSEPFLSGLAPNLQSFFRRRLPSLISGAGVPEARRKWWEKRTTFPGLKPGGAAGDVALFGTPAEVAEAEEPAIEFEQSLQKQLAAPDPLQGFLARTVTKERFLREAPRARGFFPSQLAPRTKFLTSF